MTVRDYLKITEAKHLQFLVAPGKFETIHATTEKWGTYYYPPTLEKWLDKEIIKVFVTSNGYIKIHTKD